MKQKITKAIFPVAGQGTRFLPATKSIPKEIMTLVDRPLVQYAIDEARAAGIKEFIFVTSRGKGALEDYFDEAPELERSLRKKGKSRAAWRHWIKRIRRSCSAILVKDRCVAGKTAILITAVSLLCTTLSRGPMKYFAGIFYQSKMIAMQNCAKGCAGCTTSLFPSIQMIRPYQPGKFANASANS